MSILTTIIVLATGLMVLIGVGMAVYNWLWPEWEIAMHERCPECGEMVIQVVPNRLVAEVFRKSVLPRPCFKCESKRSDPS